MGIETLKEKARRHEQQEEWAAALGLYVRAIDETAEDEQADIGLYNRAGDIQTRMGDLEGAVANYEQAITLYLEADLPNNAIAVCKKVLRNVPSRSAMFLRMGQIRAAQGFVTDARHYFLTYAEHKQRAGEMEEAFRALREFADAVPGDVDVRLSLAGQLESLGRHEEALFHFRAAQEALERGGDHEGASEVAGRIRSLDEGSGEIRSGEDHPAAGGLDPLEPGPGEVDPEPGEPGLWEPDAIDGSSDGADGFLIESTSLDPDAATARAQADDQEGLLIESTSLDTSPLSLDGMGGPGMDDVPDPAPGDEDTESLPDLPFLDLGEAASVDGPDVWDALLLPEEDGTAADPSPDERRLRLIEAASSDGEAGLELARVYLEDGDRDRAAAVLQTAHPLLLSAGLLDSAVDAARLLLSAEPDHLPHHQRFVETAVRTGDSDLLVGGLLSLAAALLRGGQEARARAVYRQVLTVHPGHPAAREALAEGTPLPSVAPGAGGRAQVSRHRTPPMPSGGSEPYIDLGSLVLDDQPERTTRWFVPAEEPSGDDEADFARMLQQFKTKVAEHLGQDDAAAHYDLGSAYREMGLLQEAIAEFQQSLRAAPGNLGTFELLGQCFLEAGEPEVAVRTLNRALRLPFDVEDDLLGIYYTMGKAHQELGNSELAREFYEKVFSLDINFKDVTERLRALR